MRVAHVRRAHGLRGELLIRALAAHPEELFTPGRRFFTGAAEDAPALVLASARPTHGGWLLAFEDLPDRTAAERWRGSDLWMEPEPGTALDDEVPFAADLVGLRLELADGTVLGTVEDYYDLPHGAVLEVARGEELVLFPLYAPFVQRVDRARGVLIVAPPDGLFE